MKRLVRDYAGVELSDIAEVNVYQGEDCCLAWAGCGQNRTLEKVRIGYRTQAERVVVFDVFAERLVHSPYIDVNGGRATFTVSLDPWLPAGLWVVKPFGKPTLLYVDGTDRYRGRYDEATLEGNVLSFKFCEKAYVSSPAPPRRVRCENRDLRFLYDARQRLLTIEGPGYEVTTTVDFGGRGREE